MDPNASSFETILRMGGGTVGVSKAGLGRMQHFLTLQNACGS